MQHHNSVFHRVLKHVPWHRFDRLVDEHQADKHVRNLTTKSQLIALIYGQMSGAQSLREIEAALESHSAKLYHLGAEKTKRSTLADANRLRPWQVFSGVFADLVGQLTRNHRRKIGETVHLIDASGLRLSALSKDWARFSAGVCGVKMHVIYDPNADCPIYAAVTPANVNDITAAKAMPIDPGATYVFDLGYYDYGWWARLDLAGCRIVTRLKTNTKLSVVAENTVANGSNILSDRIGHLPQRMARSQTNPFQEPVREIRVTIETGKVLRILTNDLDAPAQEIADIYKRRWQIELFTLPRAVRKRRAYPDHGRPHHLPAVTAGLRHPAHGSQPTCLRPSRPGQPNAPTTARPTPPTPAPYRQRQTTDQLRAMPNLNRTAVGLTRQSIL